VVHRRNPLSDGSRFVDPQLKADALALGQSVYHKIYENLQNGFAFEVPEGWRESMTHAYRNPGYL
jgi:hypothetical protein